MSFFQRNNNNNAPGASTFNSNNVPLSPSSSSTSHALTSTSSPRRSTWKGKDKAKDGGSLDDPVVISDDDDDGAPRKRRKVNGHEEGSSSTRVNGPSSKTQRRDSQDNGYGHLGSDSDEEIQALDTIPSPVYQAKGEPAGGDGEDEVGDSLAVCLVCNASLRGMSSMVRGFNCDGHHANHPGGTRARQCVSRLGRRLVSNHASTSGTTTTHNVHHAFPLSTFQSAATDWGRSQCVLGPHERPQGEGDVEGR